MRIGRPRAPASFLHPYAPPRDLCGDDPSLGFLATGDAESGRVQGEEVSPLISGDPAQKPTEKLRSAFAYRAELAGFPKSEVARLLSETSDFEWKRPASRGGLPDGLDLAGASLELPWDAGGYSAGLVTREGGSIAFVNLSRANETVDVQVENGSGKRATIYLRDDPEASRYILFHLCRLWRKVSGWI
jgi:hypothetical protein